MAKKIIISYAREDLKVVEQLHEALEARGLFVWRDVKNLFPGNPWPEALGKAINESDYVLLCWSEAASASAFVKDEWTTAKALKKTIIPYLLDDTPLPAALAAIHGLKDVDVGDVAGMMLKAERVSVPSTRAEPSSDAAGEAQGSGG